MTSTNECKILLFKNFYYNSFANKIQEYMSLPLGFYCEYSAPDEYFVSQDIDSLAKGNLNGAEVWICCTQYPHKDQSISTQNIDTMLDSRVRFVPLRKATLLSSVHNKDAKKVTLSLCLGGYLKCNDCTQFTRSLFLSDTAKANLPVYYKCSTDAQDTRFSVCYLLEKANQQYNDLSEIVEENDASENSFEAAVKMLRDNKLSTPESIALDYYIFYKMNFKDTDGKSLVFNTKTKNMVVSASKSLVLDMHIDATSSEYSHVASTNTLDVLDDMKPLVEIEIDSRSSGHLIIKTATIVVTSDAAKAKLVVRSKRRDMKSYSKYLPDDFRCFGNMELNLAVHKRVRWASVLSSGLGRLAVWSAISIALFKESLDMHMNWLPCTIVAVGIIDVLFSSYRELRS